jgi:hypothetical protein
MTEKMEWTRPQITVICIEKTENGGDPPLELLGVGTTTSS